jgi:hypothetical protein
LCLVLIALALVRMRCLKTWMLGVVVVGGYL